ncbi:MAG: membrane protein insertion efficiency factor YidD [Pedosphaera sp.]|nr:membrane protein insertion efficiency factor YidD [Pedosphaera sp.]MSU43491.1 membrane protein insertion efficiency factor YidD [Pedosphaera sp.]
MNPLQHIAVGVVRLYQWTLSPLLAAFCPQGICRYTPTCSVFAVEAIQSHGVLRGVWLTARRLMRCHPWGGCGHDPIPSVELRPVGVLNAKAH